MFGALNNVGDHSDFRLMVHWSCGLAEIGDAITCNQIPCRVLAQLLLRTSSG